MYVIALAADYDGTLAENGIVSPGTVQALEQFRNTGRKLIMVTGRELPELLEVFPRTDLFDRIVAENGEGEVLAGSRCRKAGESVAVLDGSRLGVDCACRGRVLHAIRESAIDARDRQRRQEIVAPRLAARVA